MGASSRILASLLLAGVLMGLMPTTETYDLYVGGRSGWVQNPSEGYTQWASRRRFQVNDNLVFKYKKGEDSVLVVKKEDYDSCNVSNPIQRLDGGDSVFKLDKTGPFFFISGVPDHCKMGQKIILVVLAVKKQKPTPPPVSPPPSLPPSLPPTSSPVPSPFSSPSPFPSPSPSPVSSYRPSPSPAPATATPVPSPGAAVGSPTQPPTSASPPAGIPSSSSDAGSAPAPSLTSPSSTNSSSSPSSSSVSTASRVSFGVVALVLGGVFLC